MLNDILSTICMACIDEVIAWKGPKSSRSTYIDSTKNNRCQAMYHYASCYISWTLHWNSDRASVIIETVPSCMPVVLCRGMLHASVFIIPVAYEDLNKPRCTCGMCLLMCCQRRGQPSVWQKVEYMFSFPSTMTMELTIVKLWFSVTNPERCLWWIVLITNETLWIWFVCTRTPCTT